MELLFVIMRNTVPEPGWEYYSKILPSGTQPGFLNPLNTTEPDGTLSHPWAAFLRELDEDYRHWDQKMDSALRHLTSRLAVTHLTREHLARETGACRGTWAHHQQFPASIQLRVPILILLLLQETTHIQEDPQSLLLELCWNTCGFPA